MAQELISHNVLSLDFWQDIVTYAGNVMPTGMIGCAVLNIPEETIARLDAPCMVLSLLLTGIDAKNVDMQLLPKAQEAGKAIIHILHDVPLSPIWTESSLKIISCRRFPKKCLPI